MPQCSPVAGVARWTREAVAELYDLPFNDLLFRAQTVHRQHFDPNEVQVSTLLSIKTGACPEDCAYCPQSTRFETGLKTEPLLSVDEVLEKAAAAKQAGSSRFCMGAAWRGPKDRDLPNLIKMISGVKAMGLETCMTLGMLTDKQAGALSEAGLDFYNHNLDSSPEFYSEIISTRSYQDRIETLAAVRASGMKVCCGGILGMGETRQDRVGLLAELAQLSPAPESVPINMLVRVEGTPLQDQADFDPIEFVRSIAVARIVMPRSYVRLSAGREAMDEAMQALCFAAGANSIFYGEKLLTTGNPAADSDKALLSKLGMRIQAQPQGPKTTEIRLEQAASASV